MFCIEKRKDWKVFFFFPSREEILWEKPLHSPGGHFSPQKHTHIPHGILLNLVMDNCGGKIGSACGTANIMLGGEFSAAISVPGKETWQENFSRGFQASSVQAQHSRAITHLGLFSNVLPFVVPTTSRFFPLCMLRHVCELNMYICPLIHMPLSVGEHLAERK